jgi:plastocyanin
VRFNITRGSDDDGHNAIFNKTAPGAPPDIPVVMDTTVSRTFGTVGTFPFVCTVHPGMAGEVVVH